jgi:hypothetical protein
MMCVAAMLLAVGTAAHAQTSAPAPADPQLKGAQSIPIPTRIVSDSVGVSATLLTHGSVRRIFGKEIADTYAVVQLTISNRNADARSCCMERISTSAIGRWEARG